ncbi:hypothetical protein INR49_009278 [Caranx melampygus]|nr:hypothetical protein INR49_009278 [Caranx melampygus]
MEIVLIFYLSCVCAGDPYVLHLAGRCEWTLRLPGNRSKDVVSLSASTVTALAEQICQDLGCGGYYNVEKTTCS